MTLPEAISDRLLDIFSLPESKQDAALAELCREYAEHASSIKNWLEGAGDSTPTGFTGVTESDEPLPNKIGHYGVRELLGRGGFGHVYLAEQSKPIRRFVAIKVLNLGMDSREILGRFEAERQALALMDHPNIAKVLDAGTTDRGQPYFVMELVRGDPITDYCDRNKLSTHDRLALFIQVCRAVQHAHQKGVVHRDLKPSNVLVAVHDGRPVPKVIDFGISKAVSQPLTEKTVYTHHGQMVGTLGYMSPEQADSRNQDIDTRSDIFSLGVLLFELLTGTLPVRSARLRDAGLQEMVRILREEDAERPSTRIRNLESFTSSSESGDEHTTVREIADHRQTDPSSLESQLRGDLDWVVLKALEKDRSRRYETANAFALDLERHLRDEMVSARPPSASYRMSKFMRRNKLAFAAGTVAAAALIIGFALALYGSVRSANSAEEALGHQQAAEAARDQARGEAERSQEVAAFLQELLVSANPESAVLTNLDLNEVKARAEDLFPNNPETVASVLRSLGRQLQWEGHLAEAEVVTRQALELWESASGSRSWAVVHAKKQLARLVLLQDRPEEAQEILQDALVLGEGLGASGRRLLGEVEYALAELLWGKKKDFVRAEILYRDAAESFEATVGPTHSRFAETYTALGEMLEAASRFDEAATSYQTATESWKSVYGEASPKYAGRLTRLGVFYGNGLRFQNAREALSQALEIYELAPQANAQLVGRTLVYLADVCTNARWVEAARDYRTRVLQHKREYQGLRDLDTIAYWLELGIWLKQDGGDPAAGYEVLQEAFVHARIVCPDTPTFADALEVAAGISKNHGTPGESRQLIDEWVATVRVAYPNDQATRARVLTKAGRLYGRIDESELAAAVLAEAASLKPSEPSGPVDASVSGD